MFFVRLLHFQQKKRTNSNFNIVTLTIYSKFLIFLLYKSHYRRFYFRKKKKKKDFYSGRKEKKEKN